jgi:hypothetical protein
MKDGRTDGFPLGTRDWLALRASNRSACIQLAAKLMIAGLESSQLWAKADLLMLRGWSAEHWIGAVFILPTASSDLGTCCGISLSGRRLRLQNTVGGSTAPLGVGLFRDGLDALTP